MGLCWAHLLTVFICFPLVLCDGKSDPAMSFIVRVENKLKPLGIGDVEAWYGSILHSLGPSDGYVSDYRELLHVYRTVFNGFSARLTREEAEALGKRPEVLGVFPDRIRQLHTTRTPQFLGLGVPSPRRTERGIEEVADGGSNVIIGVLDTGVWPEHPSFNDEGLDDVPSRWRGECAGGAGFACNKKLIGARYFLNGAAAGGGGGGGASARDTEGHGTHTASTAAGGGVSAASFLGFAAGTARGVAARARVAAYKVCWEIGCADSDIVAGFDAAVEDGVDVISVSLGGGAAYPYEIDPIAISAYVAVRRGVLVAASAGNSGPGRSSVTNTAPWIFTVGASSIDREFAADLVLEDGRVFTGSSLYNGTWPEKNRFVRLISGDICSTKTLNLKPVRGSIVMCDRGGGSMTTKEDAVRRLGGLGVVHSNGPTQGEGLLAAQHKIPALSITASNASALAGINPTRARLIFCGTQVGTGPAPAVTYFSSRGPDRVSTYVMKPDVIAPGLNILAGWPIGLSTQTLGPGGGDFNIISGTSMSCPHVSGISALLKGAHPEWSPAMIKSALMTTAYSQYENGEPVLDDFDYKPAGPFAIGSGHVDPVRAVEPGLVYDITEDDYFEFLCASGIGEPAVRAITQRRVVNCSGVAPEPWNLNYPAIAVVLERPRRNSPAQPVQVRRTVTHVGDGPAVYKAAVSPPEGCEVVVWPEKMVFMGKGEKASYVVGVTGGKVPAKGLSEVFGKLTWSDEGKKHEVVSPIVVRWTKY